jgi:6-phosphogluconolactonase (cycloisomerase 2 family)
LTGFRIGADGGLSQIPGSTQLLSGTQDSGCAQVSLTPDGTRLIATERIAGKHNAQGMGKGVYITWPVNADGTLGTKTVTTPDGNGPFGFTFTADGSTLLSTDQYGAFPGTGHVSSYAINDDNTLSPIGAPVANNGTDTCWITLTNDQKFAFTSSPFGGGAISSYKVGKDGRLTLLHPVATADDGRDLKSDHTPEGLIDQSLSGDSKYLYQLSGTDGAVYAFRVQPNGTLTLIDRKQVVDLLPFELGGQGQPFGLAAS